MTAKEKEVQLNKLLRNLVAAHPENELYPAELKNSNNKLKEMEGMRTATRNTETIHSLQEINGSYDHQHRITEKEVATANKWIQIIENTRDDNHPQPGDIVEYTTRHGNHYRNAHIEKLEDGLLSICECPYVPFVGEVNGRFYTNTSGGAWAGIPPTLKLLGKRTKLFKDWGRWGATANGAVQFFATVNAWEYEEPDQLYPGFSTRTHNQYDVYMPD